MAKKFIERIQGSNAISFSEGAFVMMGIAGMPLPMPTIILQQALMEEKIGRKKTSDILYSCGKIQGYNGCKMMAKKYGVKNNIELVNTVLGHFPMVGAGIMQLKKIDYEKKECLLVNYHNPFAKAYKNILGLQKDAIDHYIRGLSAGLFQYVFADEVTSIEKKCIAQGNQFCLFEIKPTSVWRKNKEFTNQIPSEEFHFDKLKDIQQLKHFLL